MADNLPIAVKEQFDGKLDCAIATYKGSGKRFFIQLAEQLDVETTEPKLNRDGEEVGERNLTLDELKDAIANNIDAPNTLLILPEARRLTTGIRYWLEDLMASGCVVCAFAPANPGRDIFLEMIEIELDLPSDRAIREEIGSMTKYLMEPHLKTLWFWQRGRVRSAVIDCLECILMGFSAGFWENLNKLNEKPKLVAVLCIRDCLRYALTMNQLSEVLQ